MKRVVALLLIATVVLFAAVAPQSDLKVKSNTPMESRQEINVTVEPIQLENKNVRSYQVNKAEAPAIAVDTNEVTLIYLEDFETGATGWTQFDGTAPDPRGAWHLMDAFGTGDSLWWCADTTLGGYRSHWMVALETPALTLAEADSILTFDVQVHTEGPGGEPDGYDAWDGGNVQISTDDGASWDVLTPEGLPYNATSLYSFGYEFNMGPGIPGWAGVQTGEAKVDLRAYNGQTVKIRFVLATDPMYDATDDASLYGMLVDSVHVGGTEYNGSVNDGLVSYPVNAASGAFWAVDTRTDSLPSGTHALRNWDSSDTTYAVLLEDYFVSPPIDIPDEAATLVYCNFEFYPDFYDETGEFPDVDFWRLEVSPDMGENWYAISNPYGDPDGDNYVYSTGAANWYDFQYAYGESCDLTDYKGETLMFRFYFHSDGDKPAGGGLMIDDFVVYSQPDLPVPTGVATAMNVDDNVEISWDDMDGTYMLPKTWMPFDPAAGYDYLLYGPGYSFRTYFGSDSALGCSWGMEYSTDGKDITFTSIDFAFPNINPFGDSVQVVLWGIDTGGYHALYASDVFVPDTLEGIQHLDISAEDITFNGDLEVEMFWMSAADYPATYATDGSSFIGITTTGGYYGVAYAVPFGVSGYGEVTYSGLEYNVYRRPVTSANPTKLNTAPLSGTSYVDETADPMTEYAYYVVCTADGFDGQLSAASNIFVMPGDIEEGKYDDGVADDIFELGYDTTVVIKLTPSTYPAKLQAVRFSADWATDVFKIKVFQDNNGMPGDSWTLTEPVITAIEGWNTHQINDLLTSTSDGVVLRDGESVWVGVKGYTAAYPAWLRADTDGFSGMASMQVPGGGWSSIAGYLRCNPMIRGYFDTDIDTTAVPEIVPAKYELAQNYPNPFNPATTIRFELREAGMTTIDVFDISGRHVRTLLNGNVDKGVYDLRFDASALSSGVYFYRLTSGSFTDIKKMMLVK